MGSAISRATVSVGPPAAAGTTMVMGRVGKACCAVLLVVLAANTASSEAKVLPAVRPRVWPRVWPASGQCLPSGWPNALAKFLRLSCMSLSLEMPGEG